MRTLLLSTVRLAAAWLWLSVAIDTHWLEAVSPAVTQQRGCDCGGIGRHAVAPRLVGRSRWRHPHQPGHHLALGPRDARTGVGLTQTLDSVH